MNAILKLIFGILFFIVITPIGLVIRLFGVDFMNKKPDSNKRSYWTRHQ